MDCTDSFLNKSEQTFSSTSNDVLLTASNHSLSQTATSAATDEQTTSYSQHHSVKPLSSLERYPSNSSVSTLSGSTKNATTQCSSQTAVPFVANSASISSPSRSHTSQYVESLKSYYSSRTIPVYDKELTQIIFKAKSFINLVLILKNGAETDCKIDGYKHETILNRMRGNVDVIMEKKTPLDVCDFGRCKDGSKARSVLVEGAPGVGKTTFVLKLCKQWANGEILKEWQVVVLAKLRDRRVRKATSLNEIFILHDRHDEAVNELINLNGKGLLLILDGYDELTETQRNFDSVVQRLLRRELLPLATLVVTSRPHSTITLDSDFLQSVDQHVEVLGFTAENIEEYILSACGDKSKLVEDFKLYLSSHPFSSSLMYNPLQCAILTNLYCYHWEHGKESFAPKTITQFYTDLVHTLLLRYLESHESHGKKRNWKIKKIPDDLPDDVKLSFNEVTKLAAEGIKERRYVFDEDDDNVPSETLGLMVGEEEVTPGIGQSVSYTFLHLTLQEYLAAVYFSQECNSAKELMQLLTQRSTFSLEEFLEHYGRATSDVQTHWPVDLFLAGRTSFNDVNPALFNREFITLAAVPLTSRLFDRDIDEAPVTMVRESLLHILYETQNLALIQSTLTTRFKYLAVSECSTALDQFVSGYCIASSNSKWRVYIFYGEDVSHLVLGLKSAKEKENIQSLVIHSSNIKVSDILLQLQPYAAMLTELVLYYKIVDGKQLSIQQDILSLYPKLSVLKIVSTGTLENILGLVYLSPFAFDMEQSLHTLILEELALNEEDYTFLQAKCSRLKKLMLNRCSVFKNNRLESFSIMMLTTPNEKSMRIRGNVVLKLLEFGSHSEILTELFITVTESTDMLEFEISQYPMLTTLEIDGHPINCGQFNTYYFLRNNLCLSLQFGSQTSNLQYLSLVNCLLDLDTLVHFLQSPYCKLSKLILHKCTMTKSAKQLTPVANNTLQYLVITSYCRIIEQIFAQVHPFLQLESLFLCISDTESNTLENIQLICSHQNNLRTLSLIEYTLSYELASTLVTSLQSPNCKLCELTLTDCHVYSPPKIYLSARLIKLTLLPDGKVHGYIAGNCGDLNQFKRLLCIQLSELTLHLKEFEYSEETLSDDLMYSLKPKSCSINYLKERIVENFMHYMQNLEAMEVGVYTGPFCRSEFTYLPLSICRFFSSRKNHLLTLVLSKCELNIDAVYLLIISLQSPCCRIKNLTLKDCTISNASPLQHFSSENSTLENLYVDNSWELFDKVISKVHPCTKLTDLNLNLITEEVKSLTEVLSCYCPVLKSLKICKYIFQDSCFLSKSIHENLQELSLVNCTLSTLALIQYLQSSNCRLCNLTLEDCLTETNAMLESTTAKNIVLKHLVISCSKRIVPKELEHLIMKGLLQWILTSCFGLETLVLLNPDCKSFPLSYLIPKLIETQGNSFQSLVLSQFKLSSEFNRSFIHSLQSLHCKLNKLALYNCELPSPDHIHLIKAIMNSNTIQHLLFICCYIETLLFEAITECLKHNKTIKELVVSNTKGDTKYRRDFLITEAQFKLLLEGVNGSVVEKLWLNQYCSAWLCTDHLLSRNVKIEYYGNDFEEKFSHYWLHCSAITNR